MGVGGDGGSGYGQNVRIEVTATDRPGGATQAEEEKAV